MELARLLRERRSVHVFEDRPVSLELVGELLDAAVWVPNHRMTQPWRFVAVRGEGRMRLVEAARAIQERREKDPEKRKEAGNRMAGKLMGVPLLLLVVMREDPNPVTREEDYASCACIIHNLSLLAWEQGLGAVWETYPLLVHPLFREALEVGAGEKIVGSVHIGYPAKVPAAQSRIPAAERLTVIDRA